MESIKKTCDHVIGVCLNNSYGGVGIPSPLKLSRVKNAIQGARDFYEESLDTLYGHLLPSVSQGLVHDKLDSFDNAPAIWRLRHNAVLYKHCSSCGVELEPIIAQIGAPDAAL